MEAYVGKKEQLPKKNVKTPYWKKKRKKFKVQNKWNEFNFIIYNQ